MIGRVTDHPAGPRHGLCGEKRIIAQRGTFAGEHRSEIIVENIRARKIRVHLATDARIARAQVATGVIAGRLWLGFVLLPLPWSREPVGRHNHPAPGQRIAPPVRLVDRRHARCARLMSEARPPLKRLTISAAATELASVTTMKSI